MLTRSRLWQLAFWITAMVVLALSLGPPSPHLPSTGWDKTNHLLSFGVLAILGRQAYPAYLQRLVIGLLLYGGAIELLQSLTQDRFAEWFDWLADALGILLGLALALRFGRFMQR